MIGSGIMASLRAMLVRANVRDVWVGLVNALVVLFLVFAIRLGVQGAAIFLFDCAFLYGRPVSY